jgi:DNA-binding PadR family transcriptional regulator
MFALMELERYDLIKTNRVKYDDGKVERIYNITNDGREFLKTTI